LNKLLKEKRTAFDEMLKLSEEPDLLAGEEELDAVKAKAATLEAIMQRIVDIDGEMKKMEMSPLTSAEREDARAIMAVIKKIARLNGNLTGRLDKCSA